MVPEHCTPVRDPGDDDDTTVEIVRHFTSNQTNEGSCPHRNPSRVAVQKVVWKWWATALLSPNYGAGEGIRTLDVNLGKVALYH